MVKLRTLLTVFTFTLKAKARNYGKGHYISDSCLWCLANHNALCQLANQSRLCLLEGGTLLKTKGHCTLSPKFLHAFFFPFFVLFILSY